LIAVQPKPEWRGKRTALAWAKAIGCTRAGVIETTFVMKPKLICLANSCALWWNQRAHVAAASIRLVNAGYPPELAYFECLHELKFIVDLIHEAGMSECVH